MAGFLHVKRDVKFIFIKNRSSWIWGVKWDLPIFDLENGTWISGTDKTHKCENPYTIIKTVV
jgi:hypothetical protein